MQVSFSSRSVNIRIAYKNTTKIMKASEIGIKPSENRETASPPWWVHTLQTNTTSGTTVTTIHQIKAWMKMATVASARLQSIIWTKWAKHILRNILSSSNSNNRGTISNSFERHFRGTRGWQLKSAKDIVINTSCIKIRAPTMTWSLCNSTHSSQFKMSIWIRLKSWTILA